MKFFRLQISLFFLSTACSYASNALQYVKSGRNLVFLPDLLGLNTAVCLFPSAL